MCNKNELDSWAWADWPESTLIKDSQVGDEVKELLSSWDIHFHTPGFKPRPVDKAELEKFDADLKKFLLNRAKRKKEKWKS